MQRPKVLANRARAILYRLGLHSNTATVLALFEGHLGVKPHSAHTNKAFVLPCSCILSMTCILSNRACFSLVILDYRDSKESLLKTCWMVFSSRLVSVVFFIPLSTASETEIIFLKQFLEA